jgi:hypothetical protein
MPYGTRHGRPLLSGKRDEKESPRTATKARQQRQRADRAIDGRKYLDGISTMLSMFMARVDYSSCVLLADRRMRSASMRRRHYECARRRTVNESNAEASCSVNAQRHDDI